jgi:hypothetical protein
MTTEDFVEANSCVLDFHGSEAACVLIQGELDFMGKVGSSS